MSMQPFTRAARLRTRADFLRVLRHGRLCPGAQCIVRLVPRDIGDARLGIAAPRRYGGAVRRNRFRRLVREAFRTSANDLGAYDYLVSPRKGLEDPTLEGIRADLLAAHRRARRRRSGPAEGAGR